MPRTPPILRSAASGAVCRLPSSIPIRSGRDLGRAVELLRRELGLTQTELADLAGVTQSSLSRLEGSRNLEYVDRIVHVLRLLGASVEVHGPVPPVDGTADDPG